MFTSLNKEYSNNFYPCKKIHTPKSEKFTEFGDGFFSVFNPRGYQDKMLITVSNRPSDIVHTLMIDGLLGQFQCLEVSKTLLFSLLFRLNNDSIMTLESFKRIYFSMGTLSIHGLLKMKKCLLVLSMSLSLTNGIMLRAYFLS